MGTQICETCRYWKMSPKTTAVMVCTEGINHLDFREVAQCVNHKQKGDKMTVELLSATDLWVAARGIRKCWASEGKSDTYVCDKGTCVEQVLVGKNDKALIHRIGNKNKHASTLEHLNYSFDIDGISRACLQEVVRHRHASISVKSTRYTLKELKGEQPFLPDEEDNYDRASEYVVFTDNADVNYHIIAALDGIRKLVASGIANDVSKYALPESFKTSFVWTINARSLQNFLALRTNKAALQEIRELAYEIYSNLPEDHKYLFTEFLYEEE